jgi:hypothetical protein
LRVKGEGVLTWKFLEFRWREGKGGEGPIQEEGGVERRLRRVTGRDKKEEERGELTQEPHGQHPPTWDHPSETTNGDVPPGTKGRRSCSWPGGVCVGTGERRCEDLVPHQGLRRVS